MKPIIVSVLIFAIALTAGVGAWQYLSKTTIQQNSTTNPPTESQSPAVSAKRPARQQVGPPPSFTVNVPEGFQLGVFAKDLGKPRDITLTDNSTVLVSIPESGKVVALPDKNSDGQADEIKTVADKLNKPHGIAFHSGNLYIAEETRVARYSFDESTLTAKEEKELFQLPKGGRHVTRSIAFDTKGTMYVSIGSTCDVCFEKDPRISTIVISDADGKDQKVFVKGLRNAVFITMNEKTQELWGTEMGRDNLGDTLPPDEINIIRQNQDYGWPVCYGNKVYDHTFGQRSPDYCQNTQSPIFEIPAHSAPLGLAFISSQQLPQDWQGDLLVAYHGSWNSSIKVGYKVVRLDVEGNTIKGSEDFLTGFLTGDTVNGRPVDLEFDKNGSLFISDDKTGDIYKVVKK